MPSSPGIGMFVEVKDPDDKVVLSRVCFEYSIHKSYDLSISNCIYIFI